MTRREIAVSLSGAALAGVAALVGCAFGFGSYLRVGWFVVIPVLLLLSGITAAILACILTSPQPLYVALVSMLWGILFLFAGWIGGAEIRLMACRRVARRADPLIQAIEEHRRSTGQWPSAFADMRDWNGLAAGTGLSVQQGQRCARGIDLRGISDVDVTFYLGPKEYLAVSPVERMVIMSFTSFDVLLRGNGDKAWQEDRFRWFFTVDP